jgi:hypothetical protein
MQCTDHPSHSQSTVHRYDWTLFVALELSKSIWQVATSTKSYWRRLLCSSPGIS